MSAVRRPGKTFRRGSAPRTFPTGLRPYNSSHGAPPLTRPRSVADPGPRLSSRIAPAAAGKAASGAPAARPPEELALIRRDLYPLLAEAEAAERLPWSPTRATVIEIQMAAWTAALPEPEARDIGARFAAAMDRLWAAEAGDPAP